MKITTIHIIRVTPYKLAKVFAFTALLVALGFSAVAQKKLDIKHADKLKGGKTPEGEKFGKLIGNVVLVQNKTTIYCDSAYFFKAKNYVEAFGKVRITEGDSVTITGGKLEYDGNSKVAQLRNNVVFTKLGTATLYTDNLDFDRTRNMAYYRNNGRLVDSVNVLTSRKGYYNVSTNMASFKRDVKVTNPDNTMTSDSLQYNSRSKIIYFRTPTTVVNKKDSSTVVYEQGFYETRSKKSILDLGTAETPDYKLDAEKFNLDDINKRYLFRRNVVMTNKKEKLIIRGQSLDYYRAEGISKVYDNAYIAKVTDNNDTLYISADTLVSIESPDPTKKRLLAYHNVKIFRKDLQGLADSLAYQISDSTLYFFKDPVLWSEGNQMTADSISMLIQNNTIDKIFMVSKAFVISQDTLINFNQIKGRKMTTHFRNKSIDRVVVEGNGESLYFALDEKTNVAMGMNKIICSYITIRFKEGRLNNLSFYVKPESNFIPPHELTPDGIKLDGFSWKANLKPKRSDVVKPQLAPLKPQKELQNPPATIPPGKK
ncbi:OstA-like protein [Pseudochryseolinea flava]|uniref:Organic solvent tolerance protein OstA n=1 Tax=Pseudochryseolinea flava TaxID=2059302 RepID=A0A364Y2Q0_9BACT|nr:OstA-like protein [Pseudochryseolinea flava]RAW01036.1 organic solvent tolerance protein OstA [Pseudochryseolinea flava]